MMGILPKGPPDRFPAAENGEKYENSSAFASSSSQESLGAPLTPPLISKAHEKKVSSLDSSYASSEEFRSPDGHATFPSTSKPLGTSTPRPDRERASLRRGSSSFLGIRAAVSQLFRLDDFEMEDLGDGFFSHVYKVVHKSSGAVMVLKKTKAGRSSKETDLREIQLLNRLSHPNLIGFMGVVVEEASAENDGRWRLHALTEFCDAGNLDALIQNRATGLGWKARISLCLDMARGMDHVHGLGYLHRDLTAVNVLLKRRGGLYSAVVADFGLAVRMPQPGQRLTEATGNPYWRAPECLVEKPYDGKADVFSFGIICCQVIGWMGADPDEGFPRTASFGLDYLRFPAPDDTPPALLTLAFTCCLMDPERRPRFAQAVSGLLDAWALLPSIGGLSRSRSDTNFRRKAAPGSLVPAFAKESPAKGRSRLSRRSAPENCVRAAAEEEGRARNFSLLEESPMWSSPGVQLARKPSKIVAESIAATDAFYVPTAEELGNPFLDTSHDRYLRRPRKESTNAFVLSIPVNHEEEEEEEEEESPDSASSSRRRSAHGHAKSGLVPLPRPPRGLRKSLSFPASPPPRLSELCVASSARAEPGRQASTTLKEMAVDMSLWDEAFHDPVAEKQRRNTLLEPEDRSSDFHAFSPLRDAVFGTPDKRETPASVSKDPENDNPSPSQQPQPLPPIGALLSSCEEYYANGPPSPSFPVSSMAEVERSVDEATPARSRRREKPVNCLGQKEGKCVIL